MELLKITTILLVLLYLLWLVSGGPQRWEKILEERKQKTIVNSNLFTGKPK